MESITKEWLENKGACSSSLEHVIKNDYIDLAPDVFINKLMDENRFSDANWLIVRVMNKIQGVKYAIFAAEQVLDIYEQAHPNDKRPREAILSAKKYTLDPCRETANAAAHAAHAANAAANAAAHAAHAAANAAAYAAAYAAYAANAANAADARGGLQSKVINYGLELLKGE